MIDLRVKTLDSRNHEFSVPDNYTVKQLKEHIAETVKLPADSQRLIYCGRVLQDDKNLSEYDVNGKVIHLVQRAPPTSSNGGPDNTTATNPRLIRRDPTWRTIFQPGGNQGNAMYLGAMAFPADLMDAQGISMPQPRQCLSQSRLAVAQGMLRKASNTLNRLENPTSSANGTSSPGSSADVSPDPNSNTNINEEPLVAASIALAVQAAAAAAHATINGPEANASATAEAGTENPPTQTGNGNNNTTGNRSRTPRTTALADLLDQLSEVNTRLQPYLAQYHQLMRDDPALQTWESEQRIFGGVSEIMHFLAHAYHALSDIMCDFSLPSPRYLRCRPVLIQHSAVLQTGIPIQAQINLSSNTSSAQTPAPETPTTSADNSSSTTSNTEPPQAQGGRTLNLPSGIEVFMDVSPGAITIDSLEATVVTNPLSNVIPRTENNATGSFSGVAPTQDFIQNLLQTLASQIQSNQIIDGTNRVIEQMRNTTTSRTTAQTSSTTATSQSAGQNSRARGNTATRPTTATQTRSTTRPHVHLTPAIQSLGASNFDPFLPCNSHHIRSSRRRASQQPTAGNTQTEQQQSGNSNTSQESDPTNNRTFSDRPNSPVILFPVANEEIITTRNLDGASSAASLESLFLSEEERSLPMSLFTQLIQRISGGDTQPDSTISQFLQTLPNYSYTEGENIFMDVFMTLAESFTFMDLMDLRLGRTECLSRVLPQLRRLMSQRLLKNEPLNGNSISALVVRFNAELRPILNILNSTRMRDEVDLVATINLFNSAMLPQILEAIFFEQDENTYQRVIMHNCRLYIYQFCAILLYCCLDGMNGMETIIRTLVSLLTTDLPPALQGWTVSSSVVNFRHFVENLNVPIEEIRQYLVFRIGHIMPLAAQIQIQEPMETETETTVTSSTETPLTVSPSDIVWQNSLPADWMPIITRDTQRQRKQSSQPPFSDAYLSGMPSKRRKIITSAKPPTNLSHVISDSMVSALGSAGLGSGPEVEVVAQRASQDPTLRSAYREEVCSTLRSNLQTNPDYKPEKYPNAAKLFDTAK